jgi:predicted metal-dependent hydrolase
VEITVIRSTKRKRTSEAHIVNGRIEVRIPSWFDAEQERETVALLAGRLERRFDAKSIDLTARADQLAARYGLPRPTSIRWVSNQESQWGSCTFTTGDIRISDRAAAFPSWVLDAIVVHELAHLVVHDHSPAFWRLAHAYPKTERALGFLIAKGGSFDDDSAGEAAVAVDDDREWDGRLPFDDLAS